jgi:hypothetical protein
MAPAFFPPPESRAKAPSDYVEAMNSQYKGYWLVQHSPMRGDFIAYPTWYQQGAAPGRPVTSRDPVELHELMGRMERDSGVVRPNDETTTQPAPSEKPG